MTKNPLSCHPPKKIHKTIMQLKLHGYFDQINGLIVGYCLDCDKPGIISNKQPLTKLVLETVADYSFPVIHLGEIGHCVENILQPLGAHIRIDATQMHIEVTEPVCSPN